MIAGNHRLVPMIGEVSKCHEDNTPKEQRWPEKQERMMDPGIPGSVFDHKQVQAVRQYKRLALLPCSRRPQLHLGLSSETYTRTFYTTLLV